MLLPTFPVAPALVSVYVFAPVVSASPDGDHRTKGSYAV